MATTWVVNKTDSKTTTILGTDQDIIQITWGDISWFTFVVRADGALVVTDVHATGNKIIIPAGSAATVQVGTRSYDIATGTVSAIAKTAPATALVPVPTTVQGLVAGQVTAVELQNTGTTTQAARATTVSQAFVQGQVPAGRSVVATIGGVAVAVQMDVKSTYADGSVKLAALTFATPAIAAAASTSVLFSLATGSTATPAAVDLGRLATNGFSYAVDLTVHGGTGDTAYHLDAVALLRQALANGTVSYWTRGAQMTEGRVTAAVTGSLVVSFDIRLYADGSTRIDTIFNNGMAMQAVGGALNYDATITQNGKVAFSQAGIGQAQYTTWHQQVWSGAGAPAANVQIDVANLERAGLIQNYDLSSGVKTSRVTSQTSALAGADTSILGAANVTQYMPMTGNRADIGPLPGWDVVWLMTQTPDTYNYMMAQGDAAGGVPWHFIDPKTGQPIKLTDYPKLWADSRAAASQKLTQALPTLADTGWAPDVSHMPDLSYLQYLATGDRYYLDQLNAQASFVGLDMAPSSRGYDQGLLYIGHAQLRAQAWGLRTLVEAASVNPDGSAEKAYFTQLVNNNLGAMTAQARAAGQGAVSGWFTADSAYPGTTQPWQQAYLASTLALAAEQGFSEARDLLAWQTNYLAGQFINGANGFSPWDGANYQLQVINTATGKPYQTWAEVSAATQAAGFNNANPGTWSDSTYVILARAALADSISVTGSAQAMEAFGWISANPIKSGFAAWFQGDPTWDIAPRLSDGNLLTLDRIVVLNDSGARNYTVADGGDWLVYETGSGDVTLTGGKGIDVLFAGGTGNATLVGGAGDDFLFGGSGATTMLGGPGNDFMKAGSGATTFGLTPSDLGNDIIAGFKIGTDHLQVAGAAPGSAALDQLIAGATMSGGDAVLTLAAGHAVTLQGVTTAQLSRALFS